MEDAPGKISGIGPSKLCRVVSCCKTSFVQRHLGAAGQMMIQAYEAFLTEVGVYGNGFAKDFETYGILATEWTWFKSIWQYTAHFKVLVELSSEYQLQPIREGDRSLMEAFA